MFLAVGRHVEVHATVAHVGIAAAHDVGDQRLHTIDVFRCAGVRGHVLRANAKDR